MVQRFIGLLLFLGAVVGAYFCGSNVLWQDDAIRRFAPVKAMLLKTDIAEHRGSKGSRSYSPEATYRYSYQGKEYTSTRVRPIGGINASRTWAQSVLDKIERAPEGGPQVTAYVNPGKPDEAFLVRDYSFSVYGGGMGTLAGAVLGLGMLLGLVGKGRTKMAAVALDDSGWQLLLPQLQMRKQFWRSVCWLIGAVMALVGWPIHWFVVAGQGGTAGLVAATIVVVVLAVCGTIVFRRWSVSHHISDARLRIRPAPMIRGQSFAFDVGIDAQVPLHVSSMTAQVVCLEHYKENRGKKVVYGTRNHVEKSVPLSGSAEVKAGEEISGAGEVVFDASVPPTTDLTLKNYPYYTWEIRLALVLEGAVDYTAVFPLEVD
jgi:hypothetical protein